MTSPEAKLVLKDSNVVTESKEVMNSGPSRPEMIPITSGFGKGTTEFGIAEVPGVDSVAEVVAATSVGDGVPGFVTTGDSRPNVAAITTEESSGPCVTVGGVGVIGCPSRRVVNACVEVVVPEG